MWVCPFCNHSYAQPERHNPLFHLGGHVVNDDLSRHYWLGIHNILEADRRLCVPLLTEMSSQEVNEFHTSKAVKDAVVLVYSLLHGRDD
jgi:hypothetical protein